jgi:N-acetylneuraminate lyase
MAFELIAAAFTPFTRDGELHLDGVTAHLDAVRRSHVGTVYIGGSTGEGPLLTHEERLALVERWVAESAGETKVIVHVGHSSPIEARELARHAAKTGADAVSAVAPFYFKPKTLDALVESCAIIASGAPDLPFYYYHAPAQTGVEFTMAPFLEAATRAIPNFGGIKFTNEDLNDFANCVDLATEHQRIYFGRDEILLASLAMGGSGAIGTTYSFMAEPYWRVIEGFASGDLERARAAQADSRRVIDIALRHGGFPAFKRMLGWAGAPCGPTRRPLVDLPPAAEAALREELESAGVLGLIGAPVPTRSS